jgi:hypothetical protein
VLKAGRFPLGLGIGSTVLAASITDLSIGVGDGASPLPADSETSVAAQPRLPVSMRVVDVVVLDDGAVSFSFAAPVDAAVLVAQLAATDQLVVVGTLAADQALSATPSSDSAAEDSP